MKRLISIFLAISLLTGFTGCGRQTGGEAESTQASMEQTEQYTQAETAPTAQTSPPAATKPTDTMQVETQPAAQPEDTELVRVLDYIPQIHQELAYATVNNFTGQRIYDFTDAYLRYGTVKKLAQVCEELAQQGIGLKIWDGFRPVSAQAALWEICPDPDFVSHPVTGSRSHCRGSAVDVTLVNLETGEELPVPTGFDNFTAYADRDYSDCSAEAAENAILLEQTMEKYGFKPYSAEWWHFSDTEEYPVEEYFDPAVPALWAANCEEFISLRETPGGAEVITQIPAGGIVSLRNWNGKYAEVTYGDLTGYVLSSYIMPSDDYFAGRLDTAAPVNIYSYEQMTADMDALQSGYPDLVTVETIGVSELGRDIPVLRIGDGNARYHVLLQGAIHGREHLTAWLLMAMADYWVDNDVLSYGDVCYHIIPMSNPDGVVISQTGELTDAQLEIYRNDTRQGNTSADAAEYAALWKSNGQGVDINRNFPAGWESIDDRQAPSSERYQGEAPFSTEEARVLRDYTLRYDFDATISYHATGSLIYYEYGENQTVNAVSKSLGMAVEQVTGYTMEGSSGVDGAGYKDWAIGELEIPSLTVEIGCGDAPLAQREIYSIFVRNYRILPAIARWLQQ